MNDFENEEQWNQGEPTLVEDKGEESNNEILRQLKEAFESECSFEDQDLSETVGDKILPVGYLFKEDCVFRKNGQEIGTGNNCNQ